VKTLDVVEAVPGTQGISENEGFQAGAAAPMPPMSNDRKTTIADAALDILATAGSRGLTHRAVDALAGLPDGSTSSCCRTRLDLVTLALHRHAARNLDDLQEDASVLALDAPSLTKFIDTLVNRLEDWMSPAKRARVTAQIEIFLIASREPSLQAVVDSQHQHFVDATKAALLRLGVKKPDSVATGLMATVNGILLGQVVNSQFKPDRKTMKAILMRAVQELSAPTSRST